MNHPHILNNWSPEQEAKVQGIIRRVREASYAETRKRFGEAAEECERERDKAWDAYFVPSPEGNAARAAIRERNRKEANAALPDERPPPAWGGTEEY